MRDDRRPPSWLAPARDTVAVTGRNLLGIRRTPQLVVFTLIQPVIFVLLFTYVFGGAISGLPGGLTYVDYLIPGVFVQTAVFGSIITAVGMATDLNNGILERFRSLPMTPSAVLVGRSLSDLTRNVFVVILMGLVGFLVGFRYSNGLVRFLAGMLLVLAFGYAMSWIFALVGMAVKDPETAQAASFPILAPLVFASSVFVPVATMPSWLQPWAENQPVSLTASAARQLMLGIPAGNDLLWACVWIVAIVAVCAPLAAWRYRRAV
ncbi:MAG TPA: ABC transporter permease [Frankiaceae bacterium]|nr:ABC transporter permease [Frankiaceae bacterium]